MKKSIQFSLIIILLLVLVQAAAGGAVVPSEKSELGTASHISSIVSTASADAQMAACLIGIHGVICVKPNVGWNS